MYLLLQSCCYLCMIITSYHVHLDTTMISYCPVPVPVSMVVPGLSLPLCVNKTCCAKISYHLGPAGPWLELNLQFVSLRMLVIWSWVLLG